MENVDNRFGLWLSMINRAAHSFFHHRLQPFGIGPGQQAYLLALQPGEYISQDELGKRLRIHKANVTRAIRRLVKKGYVLQKQTKQDARLRLVSLSAKGIRVQEQVVDIAREWIVSLKSAVNEKAWQQAEATLQAIALALPDEPIETLGKNY